MGEVFDWVVGVLQGGADGAHSLLHNPSVGRGAKVATECHLECRGAHTAPIGELCDGESVECVGTNILLKVGAVEGCHLAELGCDAR